MSRARLELTFPMDLVTEPVVYRIGRDFGVVTNIRRAEVTTEVGWLVLELSGPQAEIDKALAYLQRIGVHVGPVEKDVVE